MIVKSITGESELVSGYTNLAIKSAVNGDISLSFLLPKTDINAHAFDLVEEESILTYNGIDYRIKQCVDQLVGLTPVKSVTAPHVFFDLIDDFRYDTLTNGYKSINVILDFIFRDTGWTFSVIDSFATEEFENFGNDNCISLFKNALDRFGAEYEIIDHEVRIYKKIGSSPDLQFRYNHNVKTFKKMVDSSNLSTYIRGEGKKDANGNPMVTAEYTSPLAEVYGIRHAPIYSNETITNKATLERYLKAKIQDKPEVTIELDFVELKNAGYTVEKPNLGDVVPTIYEPLNVDLDLRVMEIEEYPESNKAPKVTLASTLKTFTKSVISYSKQLLDKIYDSNSGKLRYNVYDEAVQRATEALNNSLTQLEYPEGMGIIARDPNDPNRFVTLRSSGLGVTTDGGKTFKEAITADGVTTSVLTAGQIKTNNIQIIGNGDLFYWDGNYLIAIDAADSSKFVRLDSRGLYIAKGALTIERPDGFKEVINGVSSNDGLVSRAEPPFRGPDIVIKDRFFTTTSTSKVDVDFYTFNHTKRYLKIRCAYKTELSDRAGRFFIDGVGGESWYSKLFQGTTETSDDIVVDLGVPTGEIKSFYIRMYSGSSGSSAYFRVLRMWLSG
ncbi:phage tail protein [Bacillus paralicheniformis]|uniref:phage tail protein n=1 Tax=Bacillus paralicheniformis TaxID=1648923 RepID=UPI0022440B92|nr:phage tail protein [Bacillus paralicheniformis]MEC1023581.1 phage tail protein [Bacillus paralicheniformis]MEC1027449.1 phage tail protein [Bacillus paralicheniformis]MEC1034413.1 phage tail protein [Bacillus paralicheniformis]MEC1050204.1 phage tail protein [Bacillus paralicheniformis]MEC1059858.1 phage tail protein [Bacillus paralicheniformis]